MMIVVFSLYLQHGISSAKIHTLLDNPEHKEHDKKRNSSYREPTKRKNLLL
jgi:hypothetical protein